MSISTARSFIEKSGCGFAVSIVLAIVILGSLFYGPMCGRGQSEQAPEIKPVPIAHVGGQIVALQAVEQRFRQGSSMLLSMDGGTAPEREAEVYAFALNDEIRQSAQRDIAKRRGVKVTRERVLEEMNKQIEGELARARASLMATGQLKTGATEAEAQAALSKQLGQEVSEWRAAQTTAFEKALDDPVQRASLEDSVLGPVLIESVTAGIQLSDDQLKKDKETVVTKRIVFDPLKHKNENLFDKAEKVLAEIKGGMAFEAAMAKYSDDPAPPKKTKGEATINLERGQIAFDEKLTPLANLKVGEVSPVFVLGTGETAIYKVIRLDPKLPDNFDTIKADLKKTRIREMAIRQIRDEIEKLVDSDSLKWESKGFKVLYDWLQTRIDDELVRDEAKKLEALKAIAAEAQKIAEDPDDIGERPARLAWFVSLDAVYDKAGETEKKSMAETWMEAANGVLQSIENVDLRLEIVRLALDLKKPKEAAVSLVNAAEANAGTSEEAFKRYQSIEGLLVRLAPVVESKEDLESVKTAQTQWKTEALDTLKSDAEFNEDYTETGRTKFADINRRVAQYQAAKIIDAAQAAEVEKFQAKWRTEKQKADAEAAAERKRTEDEAKKAAEDAKKAANAPAPKPGQPPTPSSTDLGAPPVKSGG